MELLTPRQSQLLNFIAEFVRQHGYPPSIREMAAGLGAKYPNAIADLLRALERKGYLRKDGSARARAISLRRPARVAALQVPLLGRVTAGLPVLSEENFERTLHIDRSLLPAGRGKYFALRVSGDSMIGRGILDGDVVIVRATAQAAAGDIVVALVDGETTVKILSSSGAGYSLLPANPAYPPIVLEEKRFSAAAILGVVVAVIRSICR